MEIWTILFIALLLILGLVLIAVVRSGYIGQVRPEDEHRTIHQQLLKAQRQMERRRGRIWWKMDELYAEFVEKAAIEERTERLLPVRVMPQASEGEVMTGGEKDFALTDLQRAYEMFLREG